MKVILFAITLFHTGCASTNGLAVFSFSNAEVQSLLTKQMPNLTENVNLMGLPVQLNVNDVSVNIGPDNRDVISLGLDTGAEINAFAFKYPVRLTFQIEGSPYYDSEQKAVFLRNLNLLDSSVEAGSYKGNLKPLNNEVMNLLNAFLAVNPVYKLDMNNPKVALLSKVPLDMKVVEGAVQLVPRNWNN